MHATALPFHSTSDPSQALPSGFSFSVAELKTYAESWFMDCEIRQHSDRTLEKRRYLLGKFFWFLATKRIQAVNVGVLRQFLSYVTHGHKEPGGRWGNERETEPVKPGTVANFHNTLRTFLNWVVVEADLDIVPMRKIAAPVDRPDQIDPFTREESQKLIEAAKLTRYPERDSAITLFLLDTGVRVSELCGLAYADLNMPARSARILGKGGKERTVYFGRETSKALWRYFRAFKVLERLPGEALWQGEGGNKPRQPLTRSGVLQMLRRLGEAAHVENQRVSPHTFRHTFAVEFLRRGGNQFTLMELLGHTDLKMTKRYVSYVQADMAAQHRQYGPVDGLFNKKK